jgi:hypothetical protein
MEKKMSAQKYLSAIALFTAILPPVASAATSSSSCAAVSKAVIAGLAQSRIHAAIDSPLDPEAIKMGMKAKLMHSIVIDQVQYSNAIRANFSRIPLESKDMRMLATDLGPFMVEEGCKPGGSEKVAGRDAQVYTATGDMGRGEIRFKLWIDKATGLPLRATSDEPEADADAALAALGMKKRPASTAEKSNSKRNIATHAYIFGDAVKAPDAKGTLDAAALAALQAILKANP